MNEAIKQSGRIRIQAHGFTETGKKRRINEDHFYCDSETGVFIVSDGMGGRVAGETASRAVVQVFPVMLDEILAKNRKNGFSSFESDVRERVDLLNAELYNRSRAYGGLRGLGATLACLIVQPNHVFSISAGDSRIYRYSGGHLTMISRDQTIGNALVESGLLDPGKVKTHPFRNALTEYIGKKDGVIADIRRDWARSGDIWFLCTDGLVKGLSDENIQDVLNANSSAELICKRLVNEAVQKDGSDNVTAILIQL